MASEPEIYEDASENPTAFNALAVAVSALILLCGLVGYYGLRTLSADLGLIQDTAWPAADGLTDMQIHLFDQAMILHQLVEQGRVANDGDREQLRQARVATDVAVADLKASGLLGAKMEQELDAQLSRFRSLGDQVMVRSIAGNGAHDQSMHRALAALDQSLADIGARVPEIHVNTHAFVGEQLARSRNHQNNLTLLIVVTTSMVLALILVGMFLFHRAQQSDRRRLEQANDRIRRISEAKSEFLAHLSHEVRTPMNGLIGMLSLLHNTKLDSRQWDYIDTAINSGQMMLSLLNDVLDLSRVEAGRLELEHRPMELVTVCEQVSSLMARTASDKAVELVCDLAPDLPSVVVGDEIRLSQILGNLLGNSVKFTGSGEVVLSVMVESRDADRVRIRFQIQDTGIGISQNSLAEIFKAFIQADPSVNRDYGGTGLGLAISSRLVKLMGSRIEVESWPGIGSRFWFTVEFPVLEARPGVLPAPDEERGRHILICNDSSNSRRVLEGMLAMWGYIDYQVEENATHIIPSLVEAIERGRPYDIVILDDDMPGAEAMNIARAVKTRTELLSPRLIVLVSGDDERRASTLKSMGSTTLVSKPPRRAALYQALTGEDVATERASPDVSGVEGGARILLVEDDRVNQKVTLGMLAGFGHQVDVVDNGMMALAACQSRRYDLILMDCQMPIMDGYQATRELRRLENGRRHTPIVGITANVLTGDREKCLRAGMDDYLAKPVAMAELKEMVDKHLVRALRLSASA